MTNITYRSPRLLRATFIQLHSQQKAGIFCDVILQAEGEGISAHACVLSACSPFFTECLIDIKPGGQLTQVKLPGIMPSTLHKLVHYLYTSELEMTRAEVGEVLEAARKLRIPELEVLQLQGTKLVRTDSWPRLNRKCFQASDQNKLEASSKPLELLLNGPAEEKYTAAVLVVEPSNTFSETLTLERSSCLPVVVKDSNEMHISSKPGSSPCSVERVYIPNSPDRQTWVCLGPVPDSSSSTVEGNGQTVQKIKLTRLKNDTTYNSPLRPAPAKTSSDITSRLKDASCEGTEVNDGPEKCLHNSGSEICSFTSCAQKDPLQTLIKTSISKSVSTSVCSQSPSTVSSKSSMHESSTEQPNSTDENRLSQNVKNLAELPMHVSADILPPTSTQKDSANRRPPLSREFGSTPKGENHKQRLRITNGNPQTQTARESQLIELPSHLLVGKSTSTFSSDTDPQYTNITNRSPHLRSSNNAYPREDLVPSSVCEQSAIISPSNKQAKNTMWSPSPCVPSFEDCMNHAHIVQSKITNKNTQSQDALKQPPIKRLPTRQTPERCSHNTISHSKQSLAPCSQEEPVSTLLKSTVKSSHKAIGISSSSGMKSSTLKHERSFGKPAIEHEGLETNDASKAQSRVNADKQVCMTQTKPPHSSKQLMSFRDRPRSHNGVSACDDQIEVVLSVLDKIKPQSERNASSHTASLTPTLPPGQERECSTSRSKRGCSEQPKDAKKLKKQQLAQTTQSSRKNNATLLDGIHAVEMKQKKHNVPPTNHTRHHKGVLLPDRTLCTTGHKQHRSTEKTVASSFPKKHHGDRPLSRKDKDARKISGTRTVCSPAPFPISINSDSKAACLKETVSATSNSKVAVSSGETLASENSLGPVNGPCLSEDEEEIDVGGMEWDFISGITHSCFRPEPSSESEPDVNILD